MFARDIFTRDILQGIYLPGIYLPGIYYQGYITRDIFTSQQGLVATETMLSDRGTAKHWEDLIFEVAPTIEWYVARLVEIEQLPQLEFEDSRSRRGFHKPFLSPFIMLDLLHVSKHPVSPIGVQIGSFRERN